MESVIRDVLVRKVSTRQVGANNSTIWELDVDGTNEKISTFLAGLGNKAQALEGQVCDLQVLIEQNGKFTNYKLQNIQASSGSPVVAAAAKAASAAGEMTFQEFSESQRAAEQHQKDMASAKDTSIHRQVAAKVASTLLPADSTEFWQNVNDLFAYFQTGNTPFSEPTETVTSHSQHQTTNEPEPHPDDDIPF